MQRLLELCRRVLRGNDASMDGALWRLRRKNLGIRTVVDVGASDGRWTRQAMRHLPESHYLLIEAQPVHRAALERFQRRHANTRVVMQAAGQSRGSLFFDARDPMGGQAATNESAAHSLAVAATTIDHEIRAADLHGPFLIKTDTHGFEVPILGGAVTTLQRTAAIILECYNFQQGETGLLFHKMCDHMEQRHGFRCVDIVDVGRRPSDWALWQMDMVFLPDSWQGFSQTEFR